MRALRAILLDDDEELGDLARRDAHEAELVVRLVPGSLDQLVLLKSRYTRPGIFTVDRRRASAELVTAGPTERAAMEVRRVLFLDIDGVLNSRRFFGVSSKSARWKAHGAAKAHDPVANIDPVAVAYLNSVVVRTGCKVVVSSAWRYQHTPEEIAGLLRARGFVGEVVGATPKIERGDEVVPRGDEVAAWLREHPGVESYAIVDDDDDMGALGHYLVQTTREGGLGVAEAEQLARILGRRLDVHLCADDYEALAAPGTTLHVGFGCGTKVVIWAPPASACAGRSRRRTNAECRTLASITTTTASRATSTPRAAARRPSAGSSKDG